MSLDKLLRAMRGKRERNLPAPRNGQKAPGLIAAIRKIEARERFSWYRCRCANTKCRRRITLNDLPQHLPKPPKCFCGSTKWVVDWHRQLRREKDQKICECEGPVPYPHRLAWCEKLANANTHT